METLTVGIEGMSCSGCVLSVEKALGRVHGVQHVKVSFETKEATVQGHGLDVERLRLAVEDAGYDLRG